MKLLTTLSLLAIVSCGATLKQGEQGNLGQVRDAVVAPASSAIKSGVSGLCQALRDKETNFRFVYLPSNTVFNFETSYKDCTNNTQTSQVKARLIESAMGLQFSLISGLYFTMGLETATNGNISSLCKDVANLTNPFIVSGSTAVWFNFVPDGLCDNGNTNTKCLQMEVGFKQASGQYLVSITDRYDVSIVAGNLSGMVKKHFRTDLSTCAPGGRVETSHEFKGVSAN